MMMMTARRDDDVVRRPHGTSWPPREGPARAVHQMRPRAVVPIMKQMMPRAAAAVPIIMKEMMISLLLQMTKPPSKVKVKVKLQ